MRNTFLAFAFCVIPAWGGETPPSPLFTLDFEALAGGKPEWSRLATRERGWSEVKPAGEPGWRGAQDDDPLNPAGAVFDGAAALHLVPRPDALAAFDAAEAFTAAIQVKLGPSEEQKSGQNRLFGRWREPDGRGFLLQYNKWGTLSFFLCDGDAEQEVKNFAAHYTALEGQSILIFASFDPGRAAALAVFDAKGELMNRVEAPTTLIRLNRTWPHFAVSGAYWSDPQIPSGGFVGAIRRATLWNKALTPEQQQAIATDMIKDGVLPQDRPRTQSPEFWTIDRTPDPDALPLARPSRKPLKIAAFSGFEGNLELRSLHARRDIELTEIFAIVEHPDYPDSIGIPRSTWRQYTRVEGYYADQVEQKLRQALDGEFDALLIGKTDWMKFPEALRARVAERVKAGAGLVYCFRPERTDALWDELTANLAPAPADFAILPDGLAGDRAALSLGMCGRGRVAVFAWDKPADPVRAAALNAHAFTYPEALDTLGNRGWSHEFNMALLIKAIDYAAGDAAPAKIAALSLSAGGGKLSVEGKLTGDGRKVEVWLRSAAGNRVIHRETRPADPAFRVDFPLPVNGVYSADAFLRDGEGRALDFAAAAIAVAVDDGAPFAFEADKVDGLLLSGTASAAGPVRAWRLTARDGHGRLLFQNSYEPGETAWTAAIRQPIGPAVLLRAEWLDKDGVVGGGIERFMALPATEDFRREFTVSIWTDFAYDYLGGRFFDELLAHPRVGVYFPQYESYDARVVRAASEWGLGRGVENISPYLWREHYYAQKDLRELTRSPCLSDPQYQAERANRIISLTHRAQRHNPAFYSLGDEPYLLHFWEGVNGRDVCFSPHCQARFRRWLQERYGDLEALNAKWGRAYRDWGEVGPTIYEDAAEAGNLVPWMDHRLHMIDVFMSALDEAARTIRSVAGPDALVGPEGMFPADPFKGFDWNRLARDFNFLGGYGFAMDPAANRLLLGLTPKNEEGYRRISISGWYPDVNPSEAVYSRFDPWAAFLNGQDGLLMWMAGSGFGYVSHSNGITPRGTLSAYWREALEEYHAIRERYYPLLKGMDTPERGKTAIYYSVASGLLARHYSPRDAGFGRHNVLVDLFSMRQWDALLSLNGIEHAYISDRDALEGRLEGASRPERLILPATFALSDGEAEAIRRFVETGGVLIADVLPGICDERGAPRALPPLAGIFGCISPKTPALSAETVDLGGGLRLEHVANWTRADGKPARFVKRRYGAGQAFLANALLPNYMDLSKRGRAGPWRKFLLSFLEPSGLRPSYGMNNEGIEAHTYVDGQAHYVGLLRNNRWTPTEPEPFSLRFAEKRHQYDSRSGRYHGFGDTFGGTVNGDDTRLLARLPYRVNAVTLSAEVSDDGEWLDIAVAVDAGDAKPGRHAVELDIEHEGRSLAYYRRGVRLPGGSARIRLPLDLALTGELTLRATDAATGVQGSAKVMAPAGR